MLSHTYFAISDRFSLLQRLDRYFHPYCHQQLVALPQGDLQLYWTARADKAMSDQPVLLEMQLFFSCVVKKRLIFHREAPAASTRVNEFLAVLFHAVEADSCDPWEFAQNFPERRILQTPAALKMHPKRLHLDYKSGQWSGEFNI